MKKQAWIRLIVAATAIAAVVLYAHQRRRTPDADARREMLALMPPDAGAVFFADLEALRNAPFVSQLYAWAPKPQTDPEYAQFVRETGFDYERDLQRLAISVERRGQDSAIFAVADGKFDRVRILGFASKYGEISKNGTREIASVPVSGSSKKFLFSFLKDGRMALANDAKLEIPSKAAADSPDAQDWRSRFERLSGSPVFAVIRQNALAGEALTSRAPGGLRSPELSALLDQLQWITLAGKPENDRLRVAAEGEASAEVTVRQLADLLNGVVILAEAGLNDAKLRQQLTPATRDAYLELLKSVDVSRIDRGETQSVRMVFEIAPRLFEAVRTAPSEPLAPAPPPATAKPVPGHKAASKKGRT